MRHRIALLAAALVAVAATVLAAPVPAQAKGPAPAAAVQAASINPVGWTRYRSFTDPGLCLDGAAGAISLWVCDGSDYQVWGFSAPAGFIRLVNKATGQCLEHNGWQLVPGACTSADGVWNVYNVNGHVVFENLYRVSTRCPFADHTTIVVHVDKCPPHNNVANRFAWDYFPA